MKWSKPILEEMEINTFTKMFYLRISSKNLPWNDSLDEHHGKGECWPRPFGFYEKQHVEECSHSDKIKILTSLILTVFTEVLLN